jgi:uncharacterized protein (UPF0548 family)
MFLNRRPSPRKITDFLERSQSLPLSYDPIGIARESPRGFKIDEASSIIGQGGETFVRAKQALTNWQQFELGWVELHPHGAPIEVGTVVAVVVRTSVSIVNGCRIVYLTDEDEMKYGLHTERWQITPSWGRDFSSFDPIQKEVTYRIRAVSARAARRAGYPALVSSGTFSTRFDSGHATRSQR